MRRWRTDGAARRRLTAALAVLICAVLLASPARLAAEPPVAAQSGFSVEGLKRVGDYLQNEVDSGKIPGAIILIQQHGKAAYYRKFGLRDVVAKQPMTDDTIFRLSSMSNAVNSRAVM